MSFDTLNFPVISPTAGPAQDGLLLGRINASDLIASFNVSRVTPVAQVYREDLTTTGSTLVDFTTAATSAAAADFPPFGTSGSMSDGDSFYYRSQNYVEIKKLMVSIATPGVGTWTIDCQQWNATTEAWESVTGLVDGSNGFKAAIGVYSIICTGGAGGSLRLRHTDTTKYKWHRVKLVNPSGVTTAPVLDRIWIASETDVYVDVTTAYNTGVFTGLATELIPLVGSHNLRVHPGPPIGADVIVSQVRSSNFTIANEYLASDDVWKVIPDYTDPSNDFTVLGTHRIRWSRPADWTQKTLTINSVAYTGYMERHRIDVVTVQGPTPPPWLQYDSRALGAANAKGLVLGAGSYSYATFTAGANNATVATVVALINADSGATSTLSIPVGVDDGSDETDGKQDLNTALSFTAGQSMLVMCLSGGPIVDVSLRLHP
jgi:hypothetical protein